MKVVAGENEAVTDRLAAIYGAVTSAGVFRAASIKAAEAAKVIENAQRDINIAFMNEITKIFAGLGISIWDVLDAAGTKWNFLQLPARAWSAATASASILIISSYPRAAARPRSAGDPRRPLDQRRHGRAGSPTRSTRGAAAKRRHARWSWA